LTPSAAGDSRHQGDGVGGGHLGLEATEIADVIVVQEDVEVAVQLPRRGQQLVTETGVLAEEILEDLADGVSLRGDDRFSSGGGSEDGGQAYVDRHE
jgi:hypothetical protein